MARKLYPMLECLAPGRRRNLNRPIQVLARGYEDSLGALPDRNLLQLPRNFDVVDPHSHAPVMDVMGKPHSDGAATINP